MTRPDCDLCLILGRDYCADHGDPLPKPPPRPGGGRTRASKVVDTEPQPGAS